MTEAEGSTARSRREAPDPEDRELRALLTEAHRSDPPAPSFRFLWTRAQATASSGRSGRSSRAWRLASAGSLGALLLVLGLVWALTGRDGSQRPALDPTVSTPAPAWTSARAESFSSGSGWSGWRGPLDFLLDTPGRTYMESVPTFAGSSPDELSRETPSNRERRIPDVL